MRHGNDASTWLGGGLKDGRIERRQNDLAGDKWDTDVMAPLQDLSREYLGGDYSGRGMFRNAKEGTAMKGWDNTINRVIASHTLENGKALDGTERRTENLVADPKLVGKIVGRDLGTVAGKQQFVLDSMNYGQKKVNPYIDQWNGSDLAKKHSKLQVKRVDEWTTDNATPVLQDLFGKAGGALANKGANKLEKRIFGD